MPCMEMNVEGGEHLPAEVVGGVSASKLIAFLLLCLVQPQPTLCMTFTLADAPQRQTARVPGTPSDVPSAGHTVAQEMLPWGLCPTHTKGTRVCSVPTSAHPRGMALPDTRCTRRAEREQSRQKDRDA